MCPTVEFKEANMLTLGFVGLAPCPFPSIKDKSITDDNSSLSFTQELAEAVGKNFSLVILF